MLKIIEEEVKQINELKRQALNKVLEEVKENLKDFTFYKYENVYNNLRTKEDYLFHFDFLRSEDYTYSIVIGYDIDLDSMRAKIARIKTSDLKEIKENELHFSSFAPCVEGFNFPISFRDKEKKNDYKFFKDQCLWFIDNLIWYSELDEA